MPRPIALAFKALCSILGWKQGDFARALGLSRNTLRRIETGESELTPEREEAAKAILGVTDEEVEAALHLATLVLERLDREAAGGAPSPAADRRRTRLAKAFDTAARDVRAFLETRLRAIEVAEAKEEAAELWQELATVSREERLLRVETCDEFLTPAFLARLCDESEKAAAHRASEAVALADLALKVAERAPGTEGQRTGRLAYAWGFVGNARRVSNALGAAEAAFEISRELGSQSADEEREFFDPARRLDLEASLRRDQGRFDEALSLLEQALAACHPDSRVRLLLIQAATWEQHGEPERALAVLEEARPAIESGEGGLRFRWMLRFNLVRNLLHLERTSEAAALLPELQALAAQIANEMDILRLRWLEAVVRAASGQRGDALIQLGAVRREFAARALPGDAALVGLYEAQLLLREGQNAEVSALVREMSPIFNALRLEREALAAVRLFLAAAERDAATVAMARDAARSVCRLPRRTQ